MEAKMVSNIKVRDVDEPLEIRVEEIRRGRACVVYNGRLSNNRITAIKRLYNTNNQGKAEFQAENGSLANNLRNWLQQHQIYNKIEMKSAISRTLTELHTEGGGFITKVGDGGGLEFGVGGLEVGNPKQRENHLNFERELMNLTLKVNLLLYMPLKRTQ
ncbi:hypothetical protein Tco_0855524 [Tanacetum coccineum]